MMKKNDLPASCQFSRGRFALRLAGVHLAANLVVAGLVAALVFWVWYPYPYHAMMGGLHLLMLIVAVDVVCGPVLTLVLADPKKSRRELTLDLALVVAVQLGALLYGLHAVAQARPVVVAFETDRFTVVSAAQIDEAQLAEAPDGLQRLSWYGVKRVAVRLPKDSEESLQSLEMSLQGVEPSARPGWWQQETEASRQLIREKMRPLAVLQQHYPQHAELAAAVKDSGLPAEKLYFLPFTSEKDKDWVVLLDEETAFKAFARLDGFSR